MILLGLGGNLPSAQFGAPRATLEAALMVLGDAGVAVSRRSRWYRTTPVPDNGQPDFINGVAELATARGPADLLALLLAVEQRFGRIRAQRWAPRVLDLDLLAYCDMANWNAPAPVEPPIVPHPRLHERAFVLAPLVEFAPEWRHPVLGRTARELLATLPPGQNVAALDEDAAHSVAGAVAGSRAVR
jgi:2-amino-4-hydroxy-6-hydroxymethyldihydropteridine diphosphokinase